MMLGEGLVDGCLVFVLHKHDHLADAAASCIAFGEVLLHTHTQLCFFFYTKCFHSLVNHLEHQIVPSEMDTPRLLWLGLEKAQHFFAVSDALGVSITFVSHVHVTCPCKIKAWSVFRIIMSFYTRPHNHAHAKSKHGRFFRIIMSVCTRPCCVLQKVVQKHCRNMQKHGFLQTQNHCFCYTSTLLPLKSYVFSFEIEIFCWFLQCFCTTFCNTHHHVTCPCKIIAWSFFFASLCRFAHTQDLKRARKLYQRPLWMSRTTTS